MNLIAINDKDEIYEDPEYTEMGELDEPFNEFDESEDLKNTAASVEAAVKQEEEIVTMEAAAVNGGDGDFVNTFAAAIVIEDEATRDVLGVKMPGRSERLKKMPHGLDVIALKFKTRKERFKVQELKGSVKGSVKPT
ncbi:unnamed protein product [Closterium sp. NIES-64]|nr:unnamed protein product [Closterium sp. NIES-64]